MNNNIHFYYILLSYKVYKVHKLVHIELLCNRFSLKSLEIIRYGNILKTLYI